MPSRLPGLERAKIITRIIKNDSPVELAQRLSAFSARLAKWGAAVQSIPFGVEGPGYRRPLCPAADGGKRSLSIGTDSVATLISGRMIASAVVYTVSELQFTWATLCPMLGGKCSGEVFAGYDRLLGFSTVLLVVGFGLAVTDLFSWTYTTHFARIERARVALLFVAIPCLVLSIAVGVTMTGYRDLILGMGQTDMPVAETTAALQSLQTVILLSLAALLFIGALFAYG